MGVVDPTRGSYTSMQRNNSCFNAGGKVPFMGQALYGTTMSDTAHELISIGLYYLGMKYGKQAKTPWE